MDRDEAIYEDLRLELVRFATAVVGPSDAEDVVSRVVLKVLRRPGGLGGLREPRPYLIRAVINEGRSRLRTRGGETVDALDDIEAESGADGDNRGSLVRLVSFLPARQRAATFLVYWEGHTSASAAELMGCRPGTVRRYLHLAREALKEMIDDED